MARTTVCFAMLAIFAGASSTLAQDSLPPTVERPRVEVGVGGGWFFSGGTVPYDAGQVDTRVGLNAGRNWSIEGLVHFMPATSADLAGLYRAQAVWHGGQALLRPFLAVGCAGVFSRRTWPEYRYADYDTGEPRVVHASTQFHIDPPWYPTASVGFEKVLAPHLAVRAELTVAFGVNDDGIAAAFLPAASVTIPIGRYRTAAR